MIIVMINGAKTMRTLSLIDPSTGVDWVKDFIGNYDGFNDGQFVWEETQGVYLATQDTYDWWAKVIGDQAVLAERIQNIKTQILDVDEVDRIVSESSDCDLEDMALRVNAALDEAYGVSEGN
ncbi:hypothetical protein [Paenibacillus hubeiensis]|uniref:hypothetical protein n=1 Tax=Paenibacillus hubeiensis TaxID=3077330 RepID=UPI0031BB3368